jgi:hydroxymethylpyrimidine/phosphomethylpyrimidine kinase
MLASPEIIAVVAAKIRRYRVARLVVDPVMVAKGGAPLLREEAKAALVAALIPLALVLTPNVPEAEVLAGMRIGGAADAREAARRIHALGAAHVVVKGGHLEGDAVDLLYDGRAFEEFAAPRLPSRDTHGTGCTFSAAIATGLAAGRDVADAVAAAKRYVTGAIRHAWRLGAGRGPTNHLAPVLPGPAAGP